jgi:hypothetical protein
MPQGQIHSIIPILVAVVVAVPILAWRLRRLSQTRPLRLELLWVTPAIFVVLTVLSLLPQPPQGVDWIYLAVGFVIGGVLGWWRGKLMRINVDPQTHALNVKGSPAAIVFFVAIIALRYALRGMAVSQASTLHLSTAVITGAFLTFAIGLFGVQRVEMFLRGRRLLAETRATKAAA